MSDESKVDKIRALLTKAESTEFPEEAEALTTKATELMLKWGIEEAVLDSSDQAPDDETMVIRYVELFGIYSEQKVSLAHSVGFNVSGVSMFSSGKGTKRSAVFVGFKDVVDRIGPLLDYLIKHQENEMKAGWAAHKAGGLGASLTSMEQYVWRRSFMAAYGDRIYTRMKEQATELATLHGDVAALALVSRDRKTANWAEAHMNVSKPKKNSGARSYDGHAHYAGKSAANRANLGSGGIEARTGRQLG